jgi:hypothetical protein
MSRLSTNPDNEYLKELQDIDFTPVFILGLHRSGTSILYKMLTATDCFNPVTAYHLIRYHELLSNYHEQKEENAKQKLTDFFNQQGLQDRGIDQLKVTADFAEEYGFLLNTKTLRMSITKKNITLFKELCKKIQYIIKNDKPILLKNPYDFPNFLYIKQRFPLAKFVFIHRHPLKTISSTLSAIRMILMKKSTYTAQLSPLYDKCYTNPLLLQPLRFIFHTFPECGVVLLTNITAQATSYYLNNIDKLSKDEYISITYEEFCQHPQETLNHIMNKLSLNIITKIDAASLIKPRKIDIDRSVKHLQQYIYDAMKTYYTAFDYPCDL